MAMPAESMPRLLTADELTHVHLPGKATELLRGHLIVHVPPGTRHGSIAARLTSLLADHVYRHDLGIVCGQDTGFRIESDPDTVGAPDLAFLGRHRAAQIPPRGYAVLAPDASRRSCPPTTAPASCCPRLGSGSTPARRSCGSSTRRAPRRGCSVAMAS